MALDKQVDGEGSVNYGTRQVQEDELMKGDMPRSTAPLHPAHSSPADPQTQDQRINSNFWAYGNVVELGLRYPMNNTVKNI